MKLLLLRCPQCQAPLAPEQWDVVVSCRGCYTAVAIDESGLERMPVYYAAARTDKVEQWVPFWVFNGRVHITQRDTQGGGGSSQQDSEQFWGESRRLYVPAWDMPMPTAREIGQQFTQEQTLLQEIPQPNEAVLVSAAVTPQDALKLLEFIVLSMEAQRKDWLKNLQFHIAADGPQLWAIPARGQGGRWLFDLAHKV
ncbi:MAG: hypothetical protein H6658_07480 [Ardenticatenaceae bacterium]|nr:hypothetical protein [Ardenticatenaceae bacterium]